MSEIIHIPNIHRYTMEIKDNILILTPKEPQLCVSASSETSETSYITEDELWKTDITHSKVNQCVIRKNHKPIINYLSHDKSPKYHSIVTELWKTMTPKKIIKHTTYNVELSNKNGKKGFYWCKELGLSFQRKCAKGTLAEIIYMVKMNKMSMDLSICLHDGEIIHFRV